jgi:DNA recombination protein RmuC
MWIAFALALLAAAVVVAALSLRRSLRAELQGMRTESSTTRLESSAQLAQSNAQLAERSGEIDRRLAAMTAAVDRRLADLDTKVDRRLESASRTTSAIHERLGKMDEATAQILEQAKEFRRLEEVLRPPKARGGFGELLLENLLRDRLPASAYTMQHGFAGGERVDAVIRVEKLVPVDAKFPLDNYERMIEAADDNERQLFEKAFARDVKSHVDAIASKYIRPAEGTYDFALMYLPVEAIYYELVCGRTGALLAHAHERRVFPVSPTTFTSQLQVIALGLKGLQFEERAHEVMGYVASLQKDFGRFKEDFDLVGTHLGRAQARFAEADKRLDRFAGKLEAAADEQPVELGAQTLLELPGGAADAA